MSLQFLAPIIVWFIVLLAVILIDTSLPNGSRSRPDQKLPMTKDLAPFFVVLAVTAIAGSVYIFLNR